MIAKCYWKGLGLPTMINAAEIMEYHIFLLILVFSLGCACVCERRPPSE